MKPKNIPAKNDLPSFIIFVPKITSEKFAM